MMVGCLITSGKYVMHVRKENKYIINELGRSGIYFPDHDKTEKPLIGKNRFFFFEY